MNASIKSLITSGTRLWLDSVDPELVDKSFAEGVTGATSNPIIIADLLKTGRFDRILAGFIQSGHGPESSAWLMTDYLVAAAENVFRPIYNKTHGDDGYVSFELDPLLEDVSQSLDVDERAQRYIELGKLWSQGRPNRMIKVPATPAGLLSLEELAAAGIPLNVTLIFSKRQYQAARDAVWKGAQRRKNLDTFKSVYSIFVSRIDVYAASKYPDLTIKSQGLAGILNAKLLWQDNQSFWSDKKLPLRQDIVFASTGTKNPADKPWKYVSALAGSDIQTNPPQTNEAVAHSGESFTRRIDELPPKDVVDELLSRINWEQLEVDLMKDGLAKFADPHKTLLNLVSEKATRWST
jgi:transaldolase